MKMTVTIYGNRTEHMVEFLARWAICPACRGDGKTSRHIECDGGGFTASEWQEACGDDPDFLQDYLAGRYDQPCPDCSGLGRVQEIEEEYVTRWKRKLLAEYRRQQRDFAELDAMEAAERRMGA